MTETTAVPEASVATEATDLRRPAPEPTVLYLIKQVELAVRSQLDLVLRQSGLSVMQYTALTILERREGLTSAELARNSFVSAQAMVGIVLELENRELIERRRDERNARRLVIGLTESGRRLLGTCREPVDRLQARVLSGFTKRQAQEFSESLLRARRSLGNGPPH